MVAQPASAACGWPAVPDCDEEEANLGDADCVRASAFDSGSGPSPAPCACGASGRAPLCCAELVGCASFTRGTDSPRARIGARRSSLTPPAPQVRGGGRVRARDAAWRRRAGVLRAAKRPGRRRCRRARRRRLPVPLLRGVLRGGEAARRRARHEGASSSPQSFVDVVCDVSIGFVTSQCVSAYARSRRAARCTR